MEEQLRVSRHRWGDGSNECGIDGVTWCTARRPPLPVPGYAERWSCNSERRKGQKRRERDEDSADTQILWIWHPCLSTDISIKSLSRLRRVLLTSYLLDFSFFFFLSLKDLNYFKKWKEMSPNKAGEDRSARNSLDNALRKETDRNSGRDCPFAKTYQIKIKVIPLHPSTSRRWHPSFFLLSSIQLLWVSMMWMSQQRRSPAQPLKSAWNMTDLWSRTPTPPRDVPSSFQPETTSSKSRALILHCISNQLCQHRWQWCAFLGPYSPSPASLFLLFRDVILYGVVYPWCPWRKNNEDLQNAKRHTGVSLIAAESYQSLKQMAYQWHGSVLDMSAWRWPFRDNAH